MENVPGKFQLLENSKVKAILDQLCERIPLLSFGDGYRFQITGRPNNYSTGSSFAIVIPFFLEKISPSKEDILLTDLESLGFNEKTPYFINIHGDSFTTVSLEGELICEIVLSVKDRAFNTDPYNTVIPELGNSANSFFSTEIKFEEEPVESLSQILISALCSVLSPEKQKAQPIAE